MMYSVRRAITLTVSMSLFAAASETPVTVNLKSATITLNGKPDSELLAALAVSESEGESEYSIALFRDELTVTERQGLESHGMDVNGYLGAGAYYVRLRTSVIDAPSIISMQCLADLVPIQAAWKIHPVLAQPIPPSWVITDSSGPSPRVAVYVALHDQEDIEAESDRLVSQFNLTLLSPVELLKFMIVDLSLSDITALASDMSVKWIEPAQPFYESHNDGNRSLTQAEILQAPPYGLDGSGIVVAVFDESSSIPRHPDLVERVSANDLESCISSHSTHVIATLAGSGANSERAGGSPLQWRGMAPGAHVESYGRTGLTSGAAFFADPLDLLEDHFHAIKVKGARLGNQSAGLNGCHHSGDNCVLLGSYGMASQLIDQVVAGLRFSNASTFPFFNSAGNTQSCSVCELMGPATPEGYFTIAPPANAKNIMTVGAVDSNDDSIWSGSSFGPTADGRIKPDIVAPGVAVTSTIPAGGYHSASGTSTASPTAAGCLALVLEDFRNNNPHLPNPTNPELKAALLHTANDVLRREPGATSCEQGFPCYEGPDFSSGYGSVRARDAVDLMGGGTGKVLSSSVSISGTTSFYVSVPPGTNELKVTLVWDDPPAEPAAVVTLVNDLDLQVFDPNGRRHYPWVLDGSNPSIPAVRCPTSPTDLCSTTNEDHTNNVEQVWVQSSDSLSSELVVGDWRVDVVSTRLAVGAEQTFGIAGSPSLSPDCNNNLIPDANEILALPSLDCAGFPNGYLDSCETDCNSNGIADTCEIASGVVTDCNGNGRPDDPLCELIADCQNNMTLDACDIASGISTDCDGNEVPDECQLITEPDCNGNRILDSCEIENSRLKDCNGDQIPDECQVFPVIYVDDDGPSDPGPGDPILSDPDEDGTLAHPFDSIQEAVNASSPHDIISVAPGLYTGPGNRDVALTIVDPDGLPTPLTIRCAGAAGSCILDAEGQGSLFTYVFGGGEGGFVPATYRCHVLDGFWMRNGLSNTQGGAIRTSNASLTIRNCLFTSNEAVHSGGAMRLSAGCPIVSNCVFAGNRSAQGGAIEQRFHRTEIKNSIFLGNRAESGSDIYVNHNGGSFVTQGSVFAGHCDFADGFGTNDSDQQLSTDPLGVYEEATLYEDPLFFVTGHWDDNGTPGDELDDFWIDGDYHIDELSPCVDAGEAGSLVTQVEVDIDNEPRVANRTVDIGVDEYHVYCERDCDCYFEAGSRAAQLGIAPSEVLDVCDYYYCDTSVNRCVQCSRTWANACPTYNTAVITSDILCAVDGFGNYCACPNADIVRGASSGVEKGPDGSGTGIDTADILAHVEAFAGANPFGCQETSQVDLCDNETFPQADACGTSGASVSIAAGKGASSATAARGARWTRRIFLGRSLRRPARREHPGPSIELVPGVAGPSASSGSPVLQVDVFVSDVADLAGYEVRVQPSNFSEENVVLDHVEVDAIRTDFIFKAVEHHAAMDQNVGRIGGVGLLNSVSVPVQESAYLGTFFFRVESGDPSTVEFEYDSAFTALWSPSLVQIQITEQAN